MKYPTQGSKILDAALDNLHQTTCTRQPAPDNLYQTACIRQPALDKQNQAKYESGKTASDGNHELA